jgi:hypothetical protein
MGFIVRPRGQASVRSPIDSQRDEACGASSDDQDERSWKADGAPKMPSGIRSKQGLHETQFQAGVVGSGFRNDPGPFSQRLQTRNVMQGRQVRECKWVERPPFSVDDPQAADLDNRVGESWIQAQSPNSPSRQQQS